MRDMTPTAAIWLRIVPAYAMGYFLSYGLRSINAHSGPEFWRVRVGIGHPGRPEKVAGYVLHPFGKSDEEWLAPLLDEVPRLLPLLLANNASEFMNQLHLRMPTVGGGAAKANSV